MVLSVTHRKLGQWGFALLMSGIFALTAQAGTTILHELESPSIAKNHMNISSVRRILVYLPDGYNVGNQRYPTIYWIPGWKNPATTEYEHGLDTAIRAGELPPVIVVVIHNIEGLVMLNSPDFGNWEDFIVHEVVPFVDRNYPTIPDSDHRAIMGHSIGGYAAMILPVLHPGVWGAIGLNDGSVWASCEWIPPWALPDKIEDYARVDSISQVFIQLGTAITPNWQLPSHFDSPWGVEPSSFVAEKWASYCVKNPTMIAANREIFRGFAHIAVLVPEETLGTNRVHEIAMIENMQKEGINATRIPVPGGHDGHRVERFNALASEVLEGMLLEAPRALSPEGKRTVLWGQLRAAREGSGGVGE